MGSLDDSGKPYDLDHQLETCIQEFEEDRRSYWRTRTEGTDWDAVERLYGHAEKVAEGLLSSTAELVDSAEGAPEADQFSIERVGYLEEIASLLRQSGEEEQRQHVMWRARPPKNSLLQLVWERFCTQLAWEGVDRVRAGAHRILQLTDLMVKASPTEDTRRFLRRVSRCYIWGFDTECVILSRGAIDRSFTNAIPDELCDKHGLERAKYGHTLANRIKAALKEGTIDRQIKGKADKVNGPATTAVHSNPEGVRDALDVIRDTCDVVHHLAKIGNQP